MRKPREKGISPGFLNPGAPKPCAHRDRGSGGVGQWPVRVPPLKSGVSSGCFRIPWESVEATVTVSIGPAGCGMQPATPTCWGRRLAGVESAPKPGFGRPPMGERPFPFERRMSWPGGWEWPFSSPLRIKIRDRTVGQRAAGKGGLRRDGGWPIGVCKVSRPRDSGMKDWRDASVRHRRPLLRARSVRGPTDAPACAWQFLGLGRGGRPKSTTANLAGVRAAHSVRFSDNPSARFTLLGGWLRLR